MSVQRWCIGFQERRGVQIVAAPNGQLLVFDTEERCKEVLHDLCIAFPGTAEHLRVHAVWLLAESPTELIERASEKAAADIREGYGAAGFHGGCEGFLGEVHGESPDVEALLRAAFFTEFNA